MFLNTLKVPTTSFNLSAAVTGRFWYNLKHPGPIDDNNTAAFLLSSFLSRPLAVVYYTSQVHLKNFKFSIKDHWLISEGAGSGIDKIKGAAISRSFSFNTLSSCNKYINSICMYRYIRILLSYFNTTYCCHYLYRWLCLNQNAQFFLKLAVIQIQL